MDILDNFSPHLLTESHTGRSDADYNHFEIKRFFFVFVVLLVGVEVGNIGPKLGLHTADNGYLILKNYRIPRTNMLMRHSKV